jgi:hypothetical protein
MVNVKRTSLPVGTGAVAGVGAWLCGYLVTYLATIDGIQKDLRTVGLETLVGEGVDWQVVGWLFYNAHGVDTRVPRTGGFQFVTSNQNFLAAADGSLWLLYLLPVVTIGVAGAAVAWRHSGTDRTTTDAAIVGATVGVGYLLCTVAGLLLFGIDVGDGTIRPDPIPATLLAGIVYLLAMGGLGGVVGSSLAARADR